MPFSTASEDSGAQPPQPPRRPTRLVAHGDVRIDDYYWMRDRTSQEVLDHLAAENAYAAAVMQSTEELQEQLLISCTPCSSTSSTTASFPKSIRNGSSNTKNK